MTEHLRIPFPRALGLLLALCLGPLAGCGTAPVMGDPQDPYPPQRPPAVGDIRHIPTGTFVTEQQMLSIATDSRIAYVGETHDNPAAHRLELRVLEAMAQRYPGKVSLGMEMFTPDQQDALDRWVAGELSEKEFLRASRWYDTWRMDFDYYKPLLVYARDHGIPVIGLNAEKDLVRAVGRNDLSGLTPEQKQRLPKVGPVDPYHKALVDAVYGGHAQGRSTMAGFERVQLLWDETMAENIARRLQDPAGEGRHVVVVAGGNHVRFGFGIPRRVFRRLPTSYTLIGSVEIAMHKREHVERMDVTPPRFPMVPYDFVVYTAYEELERRGVKLGVLLETQDGKVTVGGILPRSNGERAGLQKGDVLLRIGDQAVAERFDVIYELQHYRPGQEAVLFIERDGEGRELKVRFQEENGHGRHGNK